MNRLHITSTENTHQPHQSQQSHSSSRPVFNKSARRQEIQATMERLWLHDPEQFNPERDAVQRQRLTHTLEAIKKQLQLDGKRAADLGCGSGHLSRLLRDAGARIDAVDIAGNALERLKADGIHHITPIQDCLPTTRLADDAYDLVVCTEVIGYLQPQEYRMLIAELSRLVHKEGLVACSTSLDINSDNALERFAAIAETEFEINQWVLRYDRLWLKLCHCFETPQRYIKASQNDFERTQEINKRRRLSKRWYQLNTTKLAAICWNVINVLARPVASYLRQHNGIVNVLEKTTKFLWDESGVSHALFIGKRRPMAFPLPANEIPIERKHKREVWD